jgi:hypothetical protein
LTEIDLWRRLNEYETSIVSDLKVLLSLTIFSISYVSK